MIKDMQIKDFDNGMFGISATVEKKNGKEQYFIGTYIAYETDRKYDGHSLIFVERYTDFR